MEPSVHDRFGYWTLWFSCCLLLSLLTWERGPHALRSLEAHAADRPAPIQEYSAETILQFADQLMRQREYFRAVTEYHRFLFTYPQDPRQAMVHFRIGLALYRGERYAEALQAFRKVVEQFPGTSYARQAALWQGETLMRQTQYESAAAVYAAIVRDTAPDDQVSQQARYQHGWALLYQRRWRDASAQFQQMPAASPLFPASQRLATEVLDAEHLPRKSPLAAGLLSGILPGSGQLYNGRVGDALLAFMLNGLFLVGIVEAVDRDETAIAGVLSFFEAGWYVGNVYGAVNGAHKHNRRATETFIRNLENRFRVEPPRAHRIIGIRLLSFDF